MRFGCNFWLEGPIDLRPTRLNCILQDLFRDTPLDYIWRSNMSNMANMSFTYDMKKIMLWNEFIHDQYWPMSISWPLPFPSNHATSAKGAFVRDLSLGISCDRIHIFGTKNIRVDYCLFYDLALLQWFSSSCLWRSHGVISKRIRGLADLVGKQRTGSQHQRTVMTAVVDGNTKYIVNFLIIWSESA